MAEPTAETQFPPGPLCTQVTLEEEFRKLGISRGDILLVHSSLRSLGWVNGGAEAIVQAFLTILGTDGTLVVPTHTDYLTLPDNWSRPPVPVQWNIRIRNTMLPFNPRTSRSRGMGEVAETVRTWPGAQRSDHPRTSFAAIGAHAGNITASHPLASMLGEESPLGALERLDGRVLLLGVGFDKCTAFHLAEYRTPNPAFVHESFPTSHEGPDGARLWMDAMTVELNSDDFGALGAAFERDRENLVTRGAVGGASCALFSLPEAVAFAQQWFADNRSHAKPNSSQK